MKPHFSLTLLLFFVSCGLHAQPVNQSALGVIPTPRHVQMKKSGFTLTGATRILLGEDTEGDRFAAQCLNDELNERGYQRLRVSTAKSEQSLPRDCIFIGSPTSRLGREFLSEREGVMKPQMKEEGYFLDSDQQGVVIIGETGKGRWYGVMTLMQMFRPKRRTLMVEGATVYDYPLYSLRAISDDISRGQVSTIGNFEKIIRFLARYKINTLFLYIEDMFAFKKYPLIGRGRGALTAGEVKELDTYARKYHVDLAPIFQTLGHHENLLYLPEYIEYAEYPGGRTLNISNERVYRLLDDMIGELSASFSSPYFNFGADETRDVGLGATKEQVVQLGLPSVLAGHYRCVAGIVQKYGKKPMMYADMILKDPEILTMIPKDIIMVDWNYDPLFQYDTPPIFKHAGFSFLVSPAVRNYAGPFPDYLNSFENIERFSRAGYGEGSAGIMTSSWNDYGGEELRELNYYGYAWSAECSWQPTESDVASFNKRFFRDFFGTADGDAIQAAYSILSSPANRYTWYELWRHPMLPFSPPAAQKGHSPVIMNRLQSIKSTMPLVLSLVQKAEGEARRERDHLRCLEFVARLNLWFARKVETQEEVRRLSQSVVTETRKDSVATAIVALCTDVLKDLGSLRMDFESLWLKTNRPEGLEILLKRYDRQISFWQEKINQVKRGIFWVDPEIESAWIYHAPVDTGKTTKDRVQHAWFRKTFTMAKETRSATLQLIGDTFVKVWVNEKYVGEVYARRSNSLSAEYQRIKIFDILPFLCDSTNIIAVECRDYSLTGSAGVNIYCELQDRGGVVQKVMTDTTWKVSDKPAGGWENAGFDDSRWARPIIISYPYTIVRPDFATGRASWIEQ